MTSLPTATQGVSGPSSLGDDLRLLGNAFASRWLLIVVIVCGAGLAGIGYLWMTPPTYMSSTDIFIDPRERNLVDINVAPTGLGSSSQGADAALVESQVAILQSRSVLGALIAAEHLDTDPEFVGGGERDGLFATLRELGKKLLYGPNVGSYAQSAPLDRAFDKLSRVLKVARVDQTYVINVAVKTRSPARSAEIANALADIYFAQSQGAVDSSATETAQTLEARLAALRASSETSRQAVEKYRSDNGLIGAQGVLVDEQQLSDLNARVTEAVVATGAAKAAFEEIQRAGVTTTSPLASEAITELRSQLEQARSAEATLAAQLGERHPRLAQARDTRVALEAALEGEFKRVLARAENAYQSAQQQEAALKALLSQYETRRSSSNAASAELANLEAAAKQDQDLYDTFAKRAKEAREQVALPTTTARIISTAQPASVPTDPKPVIVLAISGFAGAVLGFGLAWILHLMKGPPARRRKQHSKQKLVVVGNADSRGPRQPRAAE